MDGVTILRGYEVLTGWAPGWSWIGLLCAVFALASLIMGIYIFYRRPSIWKAWTVIFCMACVLATCAIICFYNAVPVYEMQYDAYLSGIVDMTTFSRHYEIIRQDELLFVLRALNPIT